MKLSLMVWLCFGSTLSSARQVLRVQPHLTDSQLFYDTENSRISSLDNEKDSNVKEEIEYQLRSRPSIYQLQTQGLSRTHNTKSTPKKSSKVLPVQTVRNYNKVNDDGSFTFGYEAADGSFKEETRGTDCVVRGKYGYVDPDGNRREFTYVSGNPCDPNALKEVDDDESFSEEKQANEGKEIDDVPNYPKIRPLQPIKSSHSKKTAVVTPPTTLHHEYSALLNSDISNEKYQVSHELPSTILTKPSNYLSKIKQNHLQITPAQTESLHSTPRTRVTTSAEDNQSTRSHQLITTSPKYYSLTSPSSIRYVQQHTTPVYGKLESATINPQSESTAATVDITPRPHIVQVTPQYLSPRGNTGRSSGSHPSSSTENPGVIYLRPSSPASSVPLASSLTKNVQLNLAAELEQYLKTVPAIPNPSPSTSTKSQSPDSSESLYQSDLILDLSRGQYKPQLYHSIPQTLGVFNLPHEVQSHIKQRIANQPSAMVDLGQIQTSAIGHLSPAARRPQPQEKIYQQQQTKQLLQSQQLFDQQQRHQKHQSQTPYTSKYQYLASQKYPQSYYYAVTPSSLAISGPASSLTIKQLDQLLHGRTSTLQ